MAFRQDAAGKNVFLSVDSRQIPHNPLHKAFKAKSFTNKDITLHFYLLDLLAGGGALSCREIVDRIDGEYLSHFSGTFSLDESTVRKKLKEYEALGLLQAEKHGREVFYRRTDGEPFPLDSWADALAFYSEADPMGVVGSFLMDKLDGGPDVFRFKHHYILHALDSDILFQLAPDPARKYEKAADLFNGERRVTLIYTENTDTDFEAEMLALLGDHPYRTHTYKYEHPNDIARRGGRSAADLTSLLNNDEDNVIIVLADNEIDVDRVLAAIASADTSITARRSTAPRFVVLGNARWNRYHNIDRTMFFKDRVIFFSTYHAKRDSEVVRAFDGAYIRAFNALPSLYSYRGFDTAMIFAPAMYNDIEYDMEGRRYLPLQTSYVFRQEGESRNHTNRNWTRVNYQPDFTITIE